MSLCVFIVEGFNPEVRGQLQRLMIEVKPYVFVGHIDAKRYTELVNFLSNRAAIDDYFIVIRNDNTLPSGYTIETHGKNRRVPFQSDGLWLVEYTRDTD